MKMLIACVLLLGALTTCTNVDAAPPPCYPGVESYQLDLTQIPDPKVERFYPYIVSDDKENCAAVWFCDVGHKWERHYVAGHGNNLDNCDYGHAKAVALLFMTRAQKDAMWNERFVDGVELDPVKQAQYQVQDAPAHALAKSVPYPASAPPSGWVTQTTVAYKRSESINGYTVKAIGTVALGIECDEDNVLIDATGKRYHALTDRNKVTMTKVGNLTPARPTTAYGACQP